MTISIHDQEKAPLLLSNGNAGTSIHTYHDVVDEPKLKTSTPRDDFSFKTLPKSKKIVFVAIGMGNCAVFCCYSLLAPFFPSEADKKGTSQTVVGFIFSCFPLWIVITSPVFGYFITKIGAKFMFMSGLVCAGCCSILFGILDKCPPGNIFIVMCFLCRSVEAIACSSFLNASFAIIAFEFPNHVATVFGSLETFSGIGLMIGPLIGGALYDLGGYGLPFWTLGGILFLCGLVSFGLIPSHDDLPRPLKGSVLQLLKSPLVWATCLSLYCVTYGWVLIEPILANHLQPLNLSALSLGLIFVCSPLTYGVTAPLIGCLLDSRGWFGAALFFGLFSSVLAFLLLGPAPFLSFIPFSLWLIIVSLCLMGFTSGLVFIAGFKILVIGAKQLGFEESLDTFGMVSGLFNASYSLGSFLGATLGGTLQDHYGFQWATTSCAIFYLLAGIINIIYICTNKKGYQEPKSVESTTVLPIESQF